MNDKVLVDVGDRVINVHTGEVFVVEQIFRMRKVGGGKYTSRKSWEQSQLLSAEDWRLMEKAAQQRAESET